MKKILVPTDFSDNASNAYHYALGMAKELNAKVKVVHVMSINIDATDPFFNRTFAEQEKSSINRLAHFVEKYPNELGQKEEVTTTTQKIDSEVVVGYAAEKVSDLSRDFDLIVMGTTGEGGVLENVFGSVSSHVAQKANCPVLLIPPGTTFKSFKNILYACDYLSADRKMVNHLLDFNNNWSSMIHFVHIDRKNEDVTDLEDKIFEKLFENGEPDFAFNMLNLKSESVAKGLDQYAKENNIDLMVLVTCRRNFLQNLFHKSMTKEIVLNAHTPVMVMHLGD